MAGTTKQMSQIKQLLILHKQGYSNRKAAAQVGMNKETANKYINMAESDPLPINELIAMPDPILEYRFKGGNPAYSDPRFDHLKQNLEYYRSQLRLTGVTMKLLWEEYKEGHELAGDRYELTQFRFHLNQLLEAEKEKSPSTILKDLYVPGEKIFFDYAGDRPEYIDLTTGEVMKVQCFVACLPYSDYCYVLCVPTQKAEDFTYAIQQCFKHLGGVPKILVPDNLKAAVIQCDRYEPKLNRLMEDLGNHYGAAVCPARPLHPKDKSQVEGQVRIIYQRVYAPLRNRKFYSLEELNKAFSEQVRKHNQKRMTNVRYSREELFLASEKGELQPLPETDFEIRSYTELRIQENGCFFLGRDKHYYSVPYKYIGEKAKVIYTRSMVSAYINGECIATHVRDYKEGQYTIVNEHMGSNCNAYRLQSSQTFIDRAARVSSDLEKVIRTIFGQNRNVPEEVYYKSCEGLLFLQKKTDPVLFNTACRAAVEYGQCRYSFISNMIKSGCAGLSSAADMANPPQHTNIRGKSQFQ